MSDDQDDSQKTEDPTDQRLRDAIKKGDVAKSQEVTALAVLLAATGVLLAASGMIAQGLSARLVMFFERPHTIPLDPGGAADLFVTLCWTLLMALAIPFAAFVFAGIAGNVIQHAPVFTAEKMKPELKKISPIGGFKRMFGPQGWVNLLKGVAKIVVIGAVIGMVVWPDRGLLLVLMQEEPARLMEGLKDHTVWVFGASCAVLVVIAAADMAWQNHSRMKRLRMTRQQVKDEHKQQEGDPHVKGKLRQIRMERGRKRMMAAVPDATVVLANPTHYAVALKYESDTMQAPLCVAKGVDAVAFRIRRIAEEHNVPVVENPPLARVLHATVEIDEPVPPEHYKAVAQVIGYVWRLKGRLGAGAR